MEDGKKLNSCIFNLISGFFLIDNFLGDTKSILFGVFDGHGGRDVMEYVRANLPGV